MPAAQVHPNSLVHSSTHSPALLELLEIKLSKQVIEYVVDCTVETVDYAMGRPTTSSSSSSCSRSRSTPRRPDNFVTFVTNVLKRAEVTMHTLLVSLVYIDRAKPHLHIGLEQWALERVFLGALIVASKYLNDSTLKNVHWALCTGTFGKRDIGRIEREYLDVLNFELAVSEDDLLSHHQGLAAVSHLSLSPRQRVHALLHPSLSSESQRRHHRRSSSSLPALEPPSPASSRSSTSSGSSCSPRTPSTTETSPPAQAPASSSSRKLITAHQFHTSTMELLRSFPIPRMTTA